MPVNAGNADGVAAPAIQQADKGFVDLAGENHLRQVNGLAVRDAQPVDELGLFAEALHQTGEFRTASVNEDDFDADQREEADVLHDLVLQFFIDHGVAAVFDDDALAVVAADIRHGLNEHFGPFGVGEFDFHDALSPTSHQVR